MQHACTDLTLGSYVSSRWHCLFNRQSWSNFDITPRRRVCALHLSVGWIPTQQSLVPRVSRHNQATANTPLLSNNDDHNDHNDITKVTTSIPRSYRCRSHQFLNSNSNGFDSTSRHPCCQRRKSLLESRLRSPSKSSGLRKHLRPEVRS